MMDNLQDVKIVEVGPRDGLQNERQTVPTDVKLTLIEKLMHAGLKTIEVTSFVSPKWVPQMADHHSLCQQLPQSSQMHFLALVPNLLGLENALKANMHEIAVFTAASEQFTQKNINCSIEQSLQKFEHVIHQAKSQHIFVRGYVSCALGCPYEGAIAIEQVKQVAVRLHHMGCDEISLGDTIGVGTPLHARELVHTLKQVIPVEQLAVHFHNTYGQALANIYACLQEGIRIIDSSIAGLGGCPYAKGASGNVATEDVVYMLNGLNIHTGVSLDRLLKASQYICQFLNQQAKSHVALALGEHN